MAKFTCNFISYVLKRTVDITVVIPSVTLPESFGDGTEKNTYPQHTKSHKYPVLYLLHGLGNNHATWTGYTNVELYAEERNIAVVMISAENKAYMNQENGDNFYDFMDSEIPDFVCGMFPISDQPKDTYIAGLSMGGLGTFIHGLSKPEKYAAMGIFSCPIFLPPVTFSGEKKEWNPEYNPEILAGKLEESGKKGIKILMACGEEDPLYRACLQSKQVLKDQGQDVTWISAAGYIHEWRFWDKMVEEFLDWIPRTDFYANSGKKRKI